MSRKKTGKLENRAAYIQSWIKKLEADERVIIQAASQAQREVDYILQIINTNL